MKQSHIPLEDIGCVLGHSNPQITTVIYGKAFEDDLRDSLDTASRYVAKPKQRRDLPSGFDIDPETKYDPYAGSKQ